MNCVSFRRACRWTSGTWEEMGDLHWNETSERAKAHTHSVQFLDTHLCPESRTGKMKFFFPDSQDFVDESFDFVYRDALGVARPAARRPLSS